MSLSATYDPSLSRVSVAKGGIAAPLNANPGFEVNTTDWTAAAGALTRSTAQFKSGVASGLLTPSGTPSFPGIFLTTAASPVVYPGETIQWSAWVRSTTGHMMTLSINWLNAVDGLISISRIDVATVAATWKLITLKAQVPVGTAKAQPVIANTGASVAGDTFYADDAQLIVVKAVVERSIDGVTWKAVRGGAEIVSGTSGVAHDYEFSDGVLNTYRCRGETATVTPSLGGIWLKSITRPFLNFKLDKASMVDTTFRREARRGLFAVKGRSAPIAVTDVRGGKDFSLRVITEDDLELSRLDYMLASGDILYLHTPKDHRVPTVYAAPGTYESHAHGITRIRTNIVEITEVQAPGPEVSGSTVTWQTILDNFATWGDVLAFFPTWADVLQYVADPSEVIVD